MNYFLAGTLQEPLRINGFQGSPLLVGSGHCSKFLLRVPLRLYPLGGSTSSLSMRGQGVLSWHSIWTWLYFLKVWHLKLFGGDGNPTPNYELALTGIERVWTPKVQHTQNSRIWKEQPFPNHHFSGSMLNCQAEFFFVNSDDWKKQVYGLASSGEALTRRGTLFGGVDPLLGVLRGYKFDV